MKKSLITYFLLWIVVIAFLAGCTNPSDQFIQGKWARGDVHFWEEWNFSQGTYLHIYDDTHDHRQEAGSYAVIEYGDNFIKLELFDQKGGIPSIEDKIELMIKFDRQAETLHLNRSDFTRVKSSTLKELSTQKAP